MPAPLTAMARRVSFAVEVKIGTMKGYSRAPLPVFVEVELREAQGGTELGMSGHVGAQSFGQIQGSIRDGMARGDFTPYLPEETIAGMLAIWERWHLNGMQAGCAHQRDMGWTLNRDNAGFFRALGPARNPADFAEVALPHTPLTDSDPIVGFGRTLRTARPGHIWTSAATNASGHPEYRMRRAQVAGGRAAQPVYKLVPDYGNEAGTWDLGEHGPILTHTKGEGRYSYDRTASYAEGGLLGRPCPACGYGFGTAWKHEALPAEVIATVKGWADLRPQPPKVKRGQPRPEAEAEGLEAFAARLGLAVRFDRDPSKDTEHQIGYRYTLIRAGKDAPLIGPFTNGRGNEQPPALTSLLECLATDARIAEECPTWQDYAGDFGDDSHAAHEGWKLGKAQTAKLRKLIGPAEIARLYDAKEAG
jgi:hypothetical protein